MKTSLEGIRHAWTELRQGIRSLTGEDAYERYLVHHREAHPGIPPLDRRRFYLEQQNQKWSGINRCC